MQYKNVHSHIFTMSNAPADFLSLYLPGFIARPLSSITDTKQGSWIVRQILKTTGNGGKRYATFLKIGKSLAQQDVFENLVNQYDDNNMQFVALTMYMEKLGAGASLSGFEGQLEEILNVKKQYPDKLKIFLGLDPRWKSSGEELRDTVAKYFNTKLAVNDNREVYPFCGIKLYPSTGFYIFDQRLKPTLEWAADNEVPVLAHCNYLGGIYNNDETYLRNNLDPEIPYYTDPEQPGKKQRYSDYCKANGLTPPAYIKRFKFFKWLLHTNGDRNNKYTCSYFLDPQSYIPVLKYFETRNPAKPLKICLAHFGGDEQIKATLPKAKPDGVQAQPFGVALNQNWHTQVMQILQTYKSAYTDISFALFDPDVHDTFLSVADTEDIGDRIMFGTDYFLTETEQAETKTYNTFHGNAVKRTLKRGNGKSAWDALAHDNINAFLQSKYI